MQRPHHHWLYFFGALCLVVIILLVERPERNRQAITNAPLFPQFDPTAATGLEIEHLLEAVRLTKTPSGWQVRGADALMAAALPKDAIPSPPAAVAAGAGDVGDQSGARPSYGADQDRVEQVLALVDGLQVGAVASRQEARHTPLQLGTLGRQVRVLNAAGEVIAHLYVGKTGPDFFSTYVRRGDAVEAYLVADQLGGRFPVRVGDWRDKTVWKLSPDDITEVAVERKDGGFRLKKNAQGEFAVADVAAQMPLDTEKLRTWLGRWTDLEAMEFVEGVSWKAAGLAKPRFTLRVALKDGTQHHLQVGIDSPHGSPYGGLADRDEIFLLPTSMTFALSTDWAEWTSPSPAR